MEYFETVIRYIMNAKEELSLNKLRKIAKKVSLERSEDIMTIAEKLRKEGKLEGIIEGIEIAIELKYGKEALILMDDIRKIKDLSRIKGIKELIREKNNFDEFREVIYKN
ncbi:hypothetical protein GM661_18190 [Iocasia frigidifontis]|uniref:Uncharacterized protein n=1 Tax=Iocasia fonsfrigidae TaxID=2682810 RepID=A0A8A7KD91_9FIRM|nr:hypothetical protein GM661_18190 [Iocasia fonsfrigidae]